MKLIIAICLIAAVAAAPAPVSYSNDNVQVVKYFFDNENYNSGYKFEFEQTDGQKRQEQGELRNAGSDSEYLVSSGVYSWVAPNGVKYTVTYVADENGFQPEVEEGPGASPALVASLVG